MNNTFSSISRLFLILLFLTGLYACIDPYDVSFNQDNKILVVEGLLTNDIESPDTIKIRYSVYTDQYIRPESISSIQASIYLVNSKQAIKLIETGSGNFTPPSNLKIDPSEKYILKFTLPNNQQYESTPQQVVSTSPILKAYDTFNPQSKVSDDGKTFQSANDVFVDFQDNPSEKNYYLWRTIHYERIEQCATCNYGVYNTFTQSCMSVAGSRDASVDYNCEGECYAIFKSSKVNVFSDLASDGRLITGRLVAQIPFYYPKGCLVEIQQMCISPDAYTFYKNLESQLQSTGGLADTPPTAIVGNINNITNPSEKIVGYFSVANIQKTRHWVDRTTATGDRAYILGHPVKLPDDPRAPFAACKKSATRTPIKPQGWQ